MIKNISLTRKEYDYSYWLIRIRGSEVLHDFPDFPGNDIEDCALLSRDNRDSEFSGWINRTRRHQFLILWDAKAFREDFFRK